MSYEYTVSIPAGKTRKFRAMVKELGGNVSGPHKCGLEQALDDIKAGRVHGPFKTSEELFASLDS